MKKNIYLALALASGLLMSCTSTDDGPKPSTDLTAEKLQNIVSVNQTVANQNKFTFSTNPALTVQILDQDGSILATGTSGEIIGVPPLTQLTVRGMNQDGSIRSEERRVGKEC